MRRYVNGSLRRVIEVIVREGKKEVRLVYGGRGLSVVGDSGSVDLEDKDRKPKIKITGYRVNK